MKSKLTTEQILAWADKHHERTGDWPYTTSGSLPEAPGETWRAVDLSLRRGLRSLPGGDSLTRLLRRERGVPERRGLYLREVTIARRREAATLRGEGLRLREIGCRLGVSPQTVSRLLRRSEELANS